MKHIFIVNPKAGKRNQTTRVLEMAEKLRQSHGLDCTCMLTQSPGSARLLARRAAEEGSDIRLYACGGDGTAGEVADGIAGFSNAAMTCIPIGTGNDFLKNFGDDEPKFSDAENLWDGDVFPLDLIDCNGRCALTIACSGIDARVADDVHKYSRNPLLSGKGSYIASLLVNVLFKGIGQRWVLSLDGREIIGEYALISVCNGRYYGGGFQPVPQARPDDGVLETMIVRTVSRTQLIRFVGLYARGEATKLPRIARVVRAKEIRLHSDGDEIVTCLDGETIRGQDMTIRLSDRRVNFFGPKGCDPNATAK
ncbi:MAG: YegS/Rv2252/BmrU family lipid kinase [Oscillospiraceae bacterium]